MSEVRPRFLVESTTRHTSVLLLYVLISYEYLTISYVRSGFDFIFGARTMYHAAFFVVGRVRHVLCSCWHSIRYRTRGSARTLCKAVYRGRVGSRRRR